MNTAVESLRPSLRQAIVQLGLDVSDAQIDTLLGYLALLQRWNAHYNLTAVRDAAQMLTQHLADCLAVIGPMRAQLPVGAPRLLDVGSGGGLPGVVIAALNPTIAVTCVDTIGKKTAFIRQVAAELGIRNLVAVQSRVEDMEVTPFDMITSRAFASLHDFTALTRLHMAENGTWMAMKGKLQSEEIAALPRSISVFHVEQLVVPGTDASRCIVWMRAIA